MGTEEKREAENPGNSIFTKKQKNYWEVQIVRGSHVLPKQNEIPFDMNVRENYNLPVASEAVRLQEYSNQNSSEIGEESGIFVLTRNSNQTENLMTHVKREYSKHARQQAFRFIKDEAEFPDGSLDRLIEEHDKLVREINAHYQILPKALQTLIERFHRDGEYFEDIAKDKELIFDISLLFRNINGKGKHLLAYAYKQAVLKIVFKASSLR